MKFKYWSSIWVTDEDLDIMARKVASGEKFDTVFYDIMASYDDKAYCHCGAIAEEVKKEVMKRVNGKD